MRIGEVVRMTGLSKDTIRYYEKIGLLKVERSNSEWNNYKAYSGDNLHTLLLIKKAKSFGFSLNEIKELIHLQQTDTATCANLNGKIAAKLTEIDQKIAELNAMKKMILSKVQDAQNLCNTRNQNTTCTVASIEFQG